MNATFCQPNSYQFGPEVSASVGPTASSSRFLSARCYPPLAKGQHPAPQASKQGQALIFHQEPIRVLVPMPRGQGQPPRGVYIPRPSCASAKLERVSKHAKQKHKYGRFGKRGALTVALKEALLYLGSLQTEEIAQARQALRRASNHRATFFKEAL